MGGSGGDRALEVADAPPTDPDADLRAYVPRVQAEWLATRGDLRSASIDGTLVFADISGFTPLTERLSHQGRVGAEHLTDVLNDVFSRLLGAAFAHGGDLLKFGGDALLLLFSGADHELQAASASADMQDELRPFRRLRTEGGTVSLRMSVGAASGSIHAALVGDSHRELVVLGPVVSDTAGLEAAASAGEVLMSPQTAAALSPADLGPPREDGVLLRGHPSAPRLVLVPPTLPSADYALGVPASIRPHLRGAGQDGEHRLAVTRVRPVQGVGRPPGRRRARGGGRRAPPTRGDRAAGLRRLRRGVHGHRRRSQRRQVHPGGGRTRRDA